MISPPLKLDFKFLCEATIESNDSIMAKLKNKRTIIKKVINKHINGSKKEISQLTIKIDSKLDNALVILSQSLNISKNKLIEDILFESGILQEVDENYMEQE